MRKGLWLILVHVNCGFVICGLYCVEVYFPHLLRFYWEKKLNFVKCIFLSDMTAWLLPSKLSMWCILFIDLHILSSPCITGIKLILLVQIFIFSCIYFVHIHVHMHACCGVRVKVREWLGAGGSFLSSCGFWGWTQANSLGGKHHYLLSHLTGL